MRKPKRESFRAYVCEVAEVNIGRLLHLKSQARKSAVQLGYNKIIQSLRDLKKAAETREYPTTI